MLLKNSLSLLKHFVLALLLFIITSAHSQNQWTTINSDYSNVTLRDIYASGSKILAVGSDISTFTPILIRSFDDGKTWDTLHLGNGPLLRSIEFVSSTTGYISSVNTSSCILRTIDGGKTWKWHWCDSDSSFTGVNAFSFVSDKIGYMAGWGKTSFSDGAIYKTTDGGTNWSHVSGNMPEQPFEFLKFFDEQNGYGGSYLFGHSNLYRTEDGGKTWTQLPVGDFQLSSVRFNNINDGIMVCGDGRIRKTSDGGETWTVVSHKTSTSFLHVDFLNYSMAYAVGTNASFESKIFYSNDGGKKWVEEAQGISDQPIGKVRFFDGRAYAIGNDGKILRTNVINQTNGMNKISREHVAIVQPNPIDDVAIVRIPEELKQGELRIMDAFGKTIRLESIQEASSEQIISSKNMTPGIYFIRLKDQSNRVWQDRFIIK